jgi:DNA topoisomerase-3
MEGAGKLIDDDELREAMQEKGLGTPATRAAIIEGLILENTWCARAAS